MKYSILGFNQRKVIDFNTANNCSLDITDLTILNYIWTAQGQRSMIHHTYNEISYVWIGHAKLLQDLPILNIKEAGLYRRLSNLIKLNLLDSKQIATDSHRGSRTYYAITEITESLQFDGDINDTNSENEDETTTLTQVKVKNGPPLPKSGCKYGPPLPKSGSNNKLNIDNKLRKNDKELDIRRNQLIPSNSKSNIVNELVDTYNEMFKSQLSKVRDITPKRKQAVLNILKAYGKAAVLEVFDKVSKSEFLLGNTGGTWKVSFDWIFKKDNFIKILEGNYDEHKAKHNSTGRKYEEGVISESFTEAELKHGEEIAERRRKEGKKVVF